MRCFIGQNEHTIPKLLLYRHLLQIWHVLKAVATLFLGRGKELEDSGGETSGQQSKQANIGRAGIDVIGSKIWRKGHERRCCFSVLLVQRL